MRERWRRPVTLFFVLLYVVGLCGFAYVLYSSIVPAEGVQLGMQSRSIGHRLFINLLGVQIGGWIPIALMLATPALAAERERNSFVEYLLAGLSPRQIVRAKFVSLTTFIVVMCAVPLPILALCFPLGGVEPMELVAGGLLEMAVAVVCASVGLLVSANHARVTGAMRHGVLMALLLLFVGAPCLLSLLQVPFGGWLVIAGILVVLSRLLFTGCEEVLTDISQHLEAYELALLPERPLSPATTQPGPWPAMAPDVMQGEMNETSVDEVKEKSSWDMWIEKVAGWNAVTQREVRVGIRGSRSRMDIAPDQPALQLPLWAWLLIGVVGALALATTDTWFFWRLGMGAFAVLTLIAATVGSSSAFTREREQKMFTQLQLCPLLPIEIVTGKIAATLLLVARSWGRGLLALFVMGLPQGAGMALISVLVVILSVLLATTIGALLSLLCRHTSIALGGALGILALAFLAVPLAPLGLVYVDPSIEPSLALRPLNTMWIEPLQLAMGAMNSFSAPPPIEGALLRLSCSMLVGGALLVVATTGVLARTRLDDAISGASFWERDLARSWH